MVVSRPGNIINVGGEREGAIKDDTQTLNIVNFVALPYKLAAIKRQCVQSNLVMQIHLPFGNIVNQYVAQCFW